MSTAANESPTTTPLRRLLQIRLPYPIRLPTSSARPNDEASPH